MEKTVKNLVMLEKKGFELPAKKQTFQMPITETKSIEGGIKISGYASTSDIDRYNDVVLPSAFLKSLETYMQNPQLLLQHKDDKPIGSVKNAMVDTKGLLVEADVVVDTDGVFEKIQKGVLRTFSIGFIPTATRYLRKSDLKPLRDLSEEEINGLSYKDMVREISELDLAEISVVAVPANSQALFSVSKSVKNFFDELETKALEEADEQDFENETDEEDVEGLDHNDILKNAVGDGNESGGENPNVDLKDNQKNEALQSENESLKAQVDELKKVNNDLKSENESLKDEKSILQTKLDTKVVNKKAIVSDIEKKEIKTESYDSLLGRKNLTNSY